MNIKSVSSKVEKFKPTRKLVTWVLVGLVLALLFTFAAIQQVKADDKAQAAHQAETAQLNDLKAENATLKVQVSKLQATNSLQTATTSSVCDWVKSMQPRYRYTVPPLCTAR